MKNFYCFFLGIFLSVMSFSQVGLGTELPHPSSILDIVSEDKGILFTRVQLTGTNDTSTIAVTAVDEGLIVYNLENSGTEPTNVFNDTFYFWNGNEWEALAKLSNIRTVLEEKKFTRILFGGYPNQTSEPAASNTYTAWKTLNLENSIKNVNNIYSNGSFTIRERGIYTFSGGVYFLRPNNQNQGNKYYQARIFKNGTDQVATSSFATGGGGTNGFAPLFWTSLLEEGDVIQVQYRMRVSNTGSDGDGSFGISPSSSINIILAKKEE